MNIIDFGDGPILACSHAAGRGSVIRPIIYAVLHEILSVTGNILLDSPILSPGAHKLGCFLFR